MSWVRVDDGFADHPKIVALNHLEFRLHIWGLCYCARHLTDGFLANAVPQGAHFVPRGDRRERVINGLLEAGLWERVDGGYLIRDFLEYNPDAASVKEKRRQNKRVARWREAQQRHRNAPSNALPEKHVTHPPPRPKGGGRTRLGARLRFLTTAWGVASASRSPTTAAVPPCVTNSKGRRHD
jgi:hypothetical protein